MSYWGVRTAIALCLLAGVAIADHDPPTYVESLGRATRDPRPTNKTWTLVDQHTAANDDGACGLCR